MKTWQYANKWTNGGVSSAKEYWANFIGLLQRVLGSIPSYHEVHGMNSSSSDNLLCLNASKTKEIVFDMRKNKNSKEPVIINNTSVALIQSYKYLGVIIQENLKWNKHVEVQEKKAYKRMYHVRRLKKQRVNSKIICLFYNSIVSSVLVYGLSCWFEACTEQQKKKVSKFQRQRCKITDEEVHASVETPSNVYKQKCISLITKIVNDKDHYLHNLAHGHLRAMKCPTERSRTTFLPVAVKGFNAK